MNDIPNWKDRWKTLELPNEPCGNCIFNKGVCTLIPNKQGSIHQTCKFYTKCGTATNDEIAETRGYAIAENFARKVLNVKR